MQQPFSGLTSQSPQHDEAAKELADLFGNPAFLLPFRPPTMSEQLKDSELEDYFSHLSLFKNRIGDLKMRDYIGNFFKISALKAAVLGNTDVHGLLAFLQGTFTSPSINLCTLGELSELFNNLKSQVQQEFRKKNQTVPAGQQNSPAPSNHAELLTQDFYDQLVLLPLPPKPQPLQLPPQQLTDNSPILPHSPAGYPRCVHALLQGMAHTEGKLSHALGQVL
jgi:hypothetical protein